MNWIKTLAIPLACLAAGFGIGMWFPDAPAEGGKAADETPPRPAGGPVPRESRPAHAAPAMPVAAPEGELLRVPARLLEGLSQAQGTRKLDEDLFSGVGVVEDALEITSAEKAAIRKSWRTTLSNIRSLETGAVRNEAVDEWTQQITVPDLTSSMEALGAGFLAETRETLGNDRAAVFLAAKQVEGMFARARSGRTLKVTTEEIGNGKWRFRIEQDGGEGRRVWLGDSVPAELRHLTDAVGIASAVNQ